MNYFNLIVGVFCLIVAGLNFSINANKWGIALSFLGAVNLMFFMISSL